MRSAVWGLRVVGQRTWSLKLLVASSVIVASQIGPASDALAKGKGKTLVAQQSTPADGAPPAGTPPAGAPPAAPPPVQHLDINEYRVDGVTMLPQIEVEEAVYPFLGPGRTSDDVEKARAALERAYNAKGYQTVSVEIPQQQVRDGIVQIKVTEGKVGRLRVKGSRYFSLDRIKQDAPSLAEGTVPNFNAVTKDIVALNQIPDRRVTPTLKAGATPGTVDVDLNVQDTFPLHGSLELNNRRSADTKPLRLSASVRYDNLWQLGHSLNVSFQVAPQDPKDAKVFSASYLARIPGVPWLSLLAYGVKNNSDVSTVGGTNVVGRGEIIGTRAIVTLPAKDQGFFHSLSAGIDYKHFGERVKVGSDQLTVPLTYYPMNLTYNATWQGEGSQTQVSAGINWAFRGMGSKPDKFDAKRFKASEGFFYFKGEVEHTHELPGGLQVFGKVNTQLSRQPLVSSEQFSAGGLDSVRGYLESAALGDYGASGTIELRSPSIPTLLGKGFGFINDWRVHVFADGAVLKIHEPLAEQESTFRLASVGFGSRMRIADHFNGSIDVGFPLRMQGKTRAFEPYMTFRLWAEF
ncbi:ShlB/FhaC/HecB family hemolysin secretion/activation protein [Reyranella sp. CPCC 100927]|uniref:ShlB/FhaC/HecB family hemolysin secretion/activation protein n=1 Tax=Reyranella sp. CPCC 100927 TaxID=2599616 RepID=UPI0011B5AC3A|nr:POTRA domain-containing protein [Reyranella sp. CPCC 100927]TWT03891.1 ShlB/FhaC/HecB family hemolysin secretion/activation protein [Reyranella sp. CPCC 100927]